MPLARKPTARQHTLVAEADVLFSELTTGQATPVFRLPPGAVVTGGSVNVVTASNAATSETLSVGDASSGTLYVNAANSKTLGRTAFTAANLDKLYTAADNIVVTRTETGAATAGKYRVIVQYYIQGKHDEVQTG